jgi:hypothetical protein
VPDLRGRPLGAEASLVSGAQHTDGALDGVRERMGNEGVVARLPQTHLEDAAPAHWDVDRLPSDQGVCLRAILDFVMKMILGVALWMFPRPERTDVQYRPVVAEAAYWLLTASTAVRFIGEVAWPGAPGSPQGWRVVLAGIGQVVALAIFFYNLLPRIRSTRKT